MQIETTCFFDKFRSMLDERLSLTMSRAKRKKCLDMGAQVPLQELQGYHLELLMLEATTDPAVEMIRVHFERNGSSPVHYFCFLCDELSRAGFDRLALAIDYAENCLYIPLFTEEEELKLTI